MAPKVEGVEFYQRFDAEWVNFADDGRHRDAAACGRHALVNLVNHFPGLVALTLWICAAAPLAIWKFRSRGLAPGGAAPRLTSPRFASLARATNRNLNS